MTITIENQDKFLHLHNIYLLIEGDVLKADNKRYADADLVALTNIGLVYLFSSLKLPLAGHTVAHVNYPGQATSLLGLASYSSTWHKVGFQISTLMQLLIILDFIHDRVT